MADSFVSRSEVDAQGDPALLVDVVLEDARWNAIGLETLADTSARAVLDHLGLGHGWEISLLACDDDRIRVLNGDFRGKGTPTNVLSWPSDERGADAPGAMPDPPDPTDPELGDIAIAFDTCAREAEAGGLALGDHATHLIVHATLHLLGFDHDDDADGDLMERLETEILARLGLHDPYAPQDATDGKVR